ncbi:hypothetical protein GCM10009105_09800 [Dokdonella soli]|uniref:Uncharacterized protein n=1 Tax=Dokdonella soli TaxID=529810 RepID=A0ABN1IDW4_9GAMM
MEKNTCDDNHSLDPFASVVASRPTSPVLAAFAARTFAETFAADNRAEDMQIHLASSYGVAPWTRELTDPDVATLLAHRDRTLVAYGQRGRLG